VAFADAVVIGKVTAIEDRPVTTLPHFGGDRKVTYQVAVVKVEEAVLGVKGLTHVKVGIMTTPVGPPPRAALPALKVDQEACLFLVRHPTEAFYVAPLAENILPKTGNAGFEKQAEQVKRAAKLLADPKAGLKAKDAEERALTAALLIYRYTTPRPGGSLKLEPIDAEESKLILRGLLDGDWAKPWSYNELLPVMAFGRLGLTPEDGWSTRGFRNPNDYPNAAKQWLREHADSYRVKRVVGEKSDKPQP
jgi:hypothetical protein